MIQVVGNGNPSEINEAKKMDVLSFHHLVKTKSTSKKRK